ncbi:hypothetical protein TNCV_1315481 [Trichonephila clavipes]|uniref:Uncharacterized protein n=1 Tax=Trichonephila clavipes TaxID=2585209 RepID=A0A8X6VIX5_TRICX|nr:hypothetical protein TNCV_1315481 [Trichonephila clavipes]
MAKITHFILEYFEIWYKHEVDVTLTTQLVPTGKRKDPIKVSVAQETYTRILIRTWTMAKNDESTLGIFERFDPKRHFGGDQVDSIWHRRTNL